MSRIKRLISQSAKKFSDGISHMTNRISSWYKFSSSSRKRLKYRSLKRLYYKSKLAECTIERLRLFLMTNNQKCEIKRYIKTKYFWVSKEILDSQMIVEYKTENVFRSKHICQI